MLALVSPTLITMEFLVMLVTHGAIWVALISLVNMLLARKVLVTESKIVVEALAAAFILLVGLVGFRPIPIGGRVGRVGLRNWLPPWHAAWQVQLLSPTALCEIIDRIDRPWPKVILSLVMNVRHIFVYKFCQSCNVREAIITRAKRDSDFQQDSYNELPYIIFVIFDTSHFQPKNLTPKKRKLRLNQFLK